jgi:hypothetical protein
VADIAANPSVLRSALSRTEVNAANAGMMAPNIGNAVERLTARSIAADPLHSQLLRHMGGSGNPDFVGLGAGAGGACFEVTTFKAFGGHLSRDYVRFGGPPALYETPSLVRIP